MHRLILIDPLEGADTGIVLLLLSDDIERIGRLVALLHQIPTPI